MLSDERKTDFIEFRGLSSDTKPVGNVMNGSIYYEIDTGKRYVFDEENVLWIETGKTVSVSDPASSRIVSLDESQFSGNNIVETVGVPAYIDAEHIGDFSDYGIEDEGWYVFARVNTPERIFVTNGFEVSGATGYKEPEIGDSYVDVAVKFGVAAESQTVTINWGTFEETFVFMATDLAVRNLDYRVTFYLYDITPYATWTWAAATGTFAANAHYFTRSGSGTTEDPYVYTEATVTTGQSIPANTYYKHSAVRFTGFEKNISYMIPYIDCPITIDLPEIDADDNYGAWFEIQMNLDAARSVTLVAPTGTTVSGNGVASPKAGVCILNMIFHKPTKKWLVTVTNWS